MKKTLSVILAVLMALGCMLAFASCGGNTEETTAANDDTTAAEETTAAASDLDYITNKGEMIIGYTEFAPMNYIDDNGNLIREIIHQEDGSFEHIDYNTEGYIIQYQAYDSNNICHTEYTREYLSTSPLKYKECYNGENFDITCDENGNIVVKGYHGTGDEYYIEEHLQNGVVVSSTTTLSYGSISQKEFINGIINKETLTHNTGLIEVSEYKDGIIIKKNSHDTEGMRWEYDYTDGEMTQEIRYTPDGTAHTTRYKNGIKTFYSYF